MNQSYVDVPASTVRAACRAAIRSVLEHRIRLRAKAIEARSRSIAVRWFGADPNDVSKDIFARHIHAGWGTIADAEDMLVLCDLVGDDGVVHVSKEDATLVANYRE